MSCAAPRRDLATLTPECPSTNWPGGGSLALGVAGSAPGETSSNFHAQNKLPEWRLQFFDLPVRLFFVRQITNNFHGMVNLQVNSFQ